MTEVGVFRAAGRWGRVPWRFIVYCDSRHSGRKISGGSLMAYESALRALELNDDPIMEIIAKRIIEAA